MSGAIIKAVEAPLCIVIFGASGDLAMRMLIPSLETIARSIKLHPTTKIIGIARSKYAEGELNRKLAEGISQYSRLAAEISINDKEISHFLSHFEYIQGNYDDEETYFKLKALITSNPYTGVLYYLATPPSLVNTIAFYLDKCECNKIEHGWTRLIVEKPFGYDIRTALELNHILHLRFPEEAIYRIDHYLAKETVMNIFTFRWGNPIWEPLWNRNYISHVEILVAESVDVGSRMGYYDKATVIRDMIQNHLLQILAITAMEPPPLFNADSIRNEKIKVFNTIREIKEEDVIFGQYHGFQEGSSTPTCAIIRFYVDNWRWQGVPFILMTGKALKKKVSSIKLVFKQVPHSIFGPYTANRPNVLKMRLQPEEAILMKQHVKVPGMGLDTHQIKLNFNYANGFGKNALQGAYERVILDSIRGDQSIFPRADEIEQSWRIVDPLLRPAYNVVHYAPKLDVRYGTVRRHFPIDPNVNRYADSSEFITATVESILRSLTKAIEEKGVANIAVDVNDETQPILHHLFNEDYSTHIDFEKVHVFLINEVPGNKKQIIFEQIAKIPHLHSIQYQDNAADAASEYTKDIKSSFSEEAQMDMLLLSLGKEGEIGSLYSGTEAVHDRENLVVVQSIPQLGEDHVTVTPRIFNNAKNIIMLASFPDRKELLDKVLYGPYCPGILPAQIMRRNNAKVTWNVLN